MPQMSPMYWTLIILTMITFMSVINSNMPKMNMVMNKKKNIISTKKLMKW